MECYKEEGVYCDVCGGECEGVHSPPRSKETEIKNLVEILSSIDKEVLDEALRRLKK